MIRDGSKQMTCSYCRERFYREQSQVAPFCSIRCQQMDLRNWLTESYGLPVEGHEDPSDPMIESDDWQADQQR